MEVDFQRHYQAEKISCLLGQALERLSRDRGAGMTEVARRLGVSRGYLYMLMNREYEGRYPIQVMLERLLEPGGEMLVNAALKHDPSLGPELVRKARAVCGGQQSLADRIGVSRDYLRRVEKGQRNMSFGIQLALEELGGG